MFPYRIAQLCVFLPLVTVHITLTIGIAMGNLTACNPYWSDCHSISATGRQYPEFFIFKALLIPTAVFMSAYWLLLHHWLRQMSVAQGKSMMVSGMGIIASLALVLYTVTLGAEGEPYALARRIGVIFYFALTAFAHLMLLRSLDYLDTQKLHIVAAQNRLTMIALVLIITAIVSAALGYFFEEFWTRWENAYEWWFSLLMISMFYQVGLMWRQTRYKGAFTIDVED
ncbi:hypothetical protein [Salinimonas chungwhensis]|uniref:hypothetical protein n=1 Tax=Salinimonas chungwhensis TaxID=265425 RepID=UPI000360AD82|nr:hypothetical protein [Salinimonas chungwhensis]